MTRLVRFSNNAVSNLAANLTLSGTSLSVTSGDGAKFPSLTTGQYFMATIVKTDGSTEVVKVTARSTDTMTIVRAAEPVGGASTAYAFTAGDRIEARLTAGVLSDEIDRLDNGAVVEAVNKSANYTLTADDVTKLVRVTTTAGTTTITLPATSALTDDYDVIVAKVTSDANTVVIARTGSTDLINGATSYTIFNQYQSAWLIADRSTNTWTVISSGMSAVNTVVDTGTGDGSTATVTLSGDPGSKNNVAFFVGGVYQQKATFSLSGTTLTPGATIANGVTWEAVWSAPLTIGTPSDGTITTAKLADGALAATVAGLAKMADGFLQATTAGLAKMADGFLAATTAGRAKMADAFVTYAKIQNVSAGKILGRDTSGSGVVQELPIAVDGSGNVIIGASATDSGAKTRLVFGASQNGLQIKDSNDTSGAAFLIFQNGSNSNFATIARDGTNNSLKLSGVSAITFPATQVASSDANTLDDYEEGTFTIGVYTNGGSITLGNNTCSYLKIGKTVFITGFITCSARSSPSGAMSFTGLPFAASSQGPAWWGGTCPADNLSGKTKMYVPATGTVNIDYAYFNDATVSQDITTSWNLLINLYYTAAN